MGCEQDTAPAHPCLQKVPPLGATGTAHAGQGQLTAGSSQAGHHRTAALLFISHGCLRLTTFVVPEICSADVAQTHSTFCHSEQKRLPSSSCDSEMSGFASSSQRASHLLGRCTIASAAQLLKPFSAKIKTPMLNIYRRYHCPIFWKGKASKYRKNQ